MTVASVGAERFDEAFLDGLRLEGDPTADDAATAFIDGELGAHAAGLMGALIARSVGKAESDEASRTLRQFATYRPPFPRWTDTDMLQRGQDIFAEFVPQLGLGLWM